MLAAVTSWLIDKSAYKHLAASAEAEVWVDRIERGLVRISTITRPEVGYSFRDAAQARMESVSPPAEAAVTGQSIELRRV